MNDPIADMLSRIKNGMNARLDAIDIPHSKIKEEMARIFTSEGYVAKYDVMQRMDKKFIRLTLKYKQDKTGLIAGMKRVSKAGRRVYVDVDSIPKVQAGFGTAILSTSNGIMTDEEAREKKVGGEVLCHIW